MGTASSDRYGQVAYNPALDSLAYFDGNTWVSLTTGAQTAFFGNELATGQEAVPRELATATATLSSGTLRLTFFTARKSETVANMRMLAVTTAAAPTPTLARMGLWTVDGSGNLTLAASSANDTALFSTASVNGTAYTEAFTVPFPVVKGTRYAVGALVVTAAAAPTVLATPSTLPVTEGAVSPRICGVLTGQADLPATVTAGLVGATNVRPYVALTT